MIHPRPPPSADHAEPHPRDLCCGLCQRPIIAGRAQFVVLRDSSVIDPEDPSLDGRRVVAACTSEHVDALRAATPPWCDEQLWFGQLSRAQQQPHRGAASPLPAAARRAGLTLEQARRALAWRRATGHREERSTRV
jgi:hypothetical protein